MLDIAVEAWMNSLVKNLSYIPTHGRTSIDQTTKTYVHCLCVDTGNSLDNLSRVMAGRDAWRKQEKVRVGVKRIKYPHDDDNNFPNF